MIIYSNLHVDMQFNRTAARTNEIIYDLVRTSVGLLPRLHYQSNTCHFCTKVCLDLLRRAESLACYDP